MRGAAALGITLSLCAACSKPETKTAEARPEAATSVPSKTTAPSAGVSSVAAAGSRRPAEERTWTFEQTPVGRMSAVVLVPAHEPEARFPVLIAFHGRGEALKGPERGARGWVDDYALGRALERVAHPPLRSEDFLSFVTETRLAELNGALSRQPYRGLIIVCPYTPDVLRGDDPFPKMPPLARFVVETLLPRIYRETPAIGTPAATGIDGVSLGGRAALGIGLLHPEAFGAVAGLQAAFDVENAAEIGERARRARERNPTLAFGLLTSDDDYFLAANRAMADAMRALGVPVHYRVSPGPHDYEFNRGPAAYEMLLFHDRALHGEASP